MRIAKNLTEGNIYKNFFFFAIPLILASLLSQAYSMIDSAIAGKFINDFAVGAVGAASSFDTMLSTMFTGFAIGFSIYTARLFGEKNYARLKNDMYGMLLFLCVLILLVGGACVLFREALFDYLKVDEAIRADALAYFTVCKLGYLPIMLSVTLVQILNALGVTTYALYMSLLSAALNIGGNLLSVIVFDMGVVGLALSTVLSSLVVTVLYLRKLIAALSEMPSEGFRFRFSFAFLRHSVRYAGPASLQQMVMYLSGLVISPSINAIGPAATTGYAVALNMYNLCAQSYQNSSKALSTYTAQCIGAGKYTRIRRGLFVGLLQGIVLLLPFLLVTTIFARPLASIFFSDGYTGEAYLYAVRFATVFLPFIVINMINNLAHSFFRGMGTMAALVISTAIGTVVRIVATLLLTSTMAMDGVYLGWVISWAAEAVFCVLLYLCRYRTEKQIILRAQES